MRATTAALAISVTLLTGCPTEDSGGNQPPGEFSIVLGPTAPVTTDDLIVTVVSTASDPDGDVVSYRFQWLRDGVPVPEYVESVIPSSVTAKKETWTASVTATDGSADGPAVTAQAVIGNLPPAVQATLSPESPRSDEPLVVTAAGEDPDGDAVTFDYAWQRNGEDVAPNGPAIDFGDTARDDVWSVTVTPQDGDDPGESVSLSATVRNALPWAADVAIRPDPPTDLDQARCSAGETGDADGDNVALSTTWFLNGAAIVGLSSPTLDADRFDVGETLACEMVPTDGREDGEAVRSPDAVVVDCPTWFVDDDNDTYGDPNTGTNSCDPDPAWVQDDTDCDDGDSTAFPGAPEACTSLDLNCDGVFSSTPCFGSCKDIFDGGASTGDGVYGIDPDGAGPAAPFDVYCDMTVDGGGWTMIQRTVWDDVASAVLLTNYAAWYSTTVGVPVSGVYRLRGDLWNGLDVLHDAMSRVDVRKDATGLSCDPLFYATSGADLNITASAASVTGNTNYVYRGNNFQATDTPNNTCVSQYGATPWFYGFCCWICPSYAGSLFSVPRPTQSASSLDVDFFGNQDDDVCNGEAPVLSGAPNYLGANVIEFYVR